MPPFSEALVGEPFVMRGEMPRGDEIAISDSFAGKMVLKRITSPSRVACLAISGLLSQAIIGAGGAPRLPAIDSS